MTELDRVALLVAILRDKSARIDERDDAAIDLGDYTDQRVVDALIEVGSDEAENDLVSGSCGESLAFIAARTGTKAKHWLSCLSLQAASEFRRSLNALRPGLLD